MSAFELPDEAGWVCDAPGATPYKVTQWLPTKIRRHVNAQSFASACYSHARTVATLARHMQQDPPGQVRDALLHVERCTVQLQDAITQLAGTDAHRAVAVTVDELRVFAGARESGEPIFTSISELGFRGLPDLLGRLERDLQGLAELTASVRKDVHQLALLLQDAADEIQTNRNPTRRLESLLVSLIVESYIAHFGEKPTKRGWFADILCARVGKAIGLTIGHTLVGDMVAAAKVPPKDPVVRSRRRPAG